MNTNDFKQIVNAMGTIMPTIGGRPFKVVAEELRAFDHVLADKILACNDVWTDVQKYINSRKNEK